MATHFDALVLPIHVVIGWFLGAVAWRTCGRDCAASGMGATTQRKKLAYNVWLYAPIFDLSDFKRLSKGLTTQ